jgi:hypothetical protein
VAFKIADAYVEVHGKVDDPSFRRAAKRVAERAGRDFTDGFGRAARKQFGGMDVFGGIDDVEDDAEEKGKKAGNRFADAFGLSASRRWRRMKSLFLEPINAVSSALSAIRGPSMRLGIVSTILGLIPSAGKAASALGASLIPALLSLGSVIGVVRLMLGNLSKDIKSQTLGALNSMAGRIRELAREAAKPGLNQLMEGVVKNGPLFERYIQRIARAVGDALGEVGTLLGNQGFVNKLNSLLEQVAESTGVWTKSLDDVVEMVVTLGDAAAPIFHEMSVAVNRLTDRWRDWLNLKYETGELQEFLQQAWEELQRWGRILGNVIGGLFNIFAAGVGPSSQFAENLERMTASFKKWTEESANVEKIRKVFQFMVDHVDDFFRIAAAALAVAAGLKGIGAAMEVVDFARMLIMLGPIGVALAVVGAAIAGVAAAFFYAYSTSELFRAKVGELWTMIQERLFPILKEWKTFWDEELGPAVEKFAVDIMGQVIEGFDFLLTKYQENKEGLQELMDLFVMALPIVGFFVSTAINKLTSFVGQIIVVAGWVGRLIGVIRKVPVRWVTKYLFSPGAAVAWILRVTGLTKRIPKSWKTAYRFLAGGAIGAIKGIISWIGRIPRNVKTTFTSVTRNITESITRFAGGLFGNASGGLIGGGRGMASGGLGGGRNILVGEQGPEMVNLPFGSKVTPAGQTRAQLARGGQSGGEPIVLNLYIAGNRVGEVLVDPLRKAVRSRGGNVQVVLGS